MSDIVFRKSIKYRIKRERTQPITRMKFGFLEKQRHHLRRMRSFLQKTDIIENFQFRVADRDQDFNHSKIENHSFGLNIGSTKKRSYIHEKIKLKKIENFTL